MTLRAAVAFVLLCAAPAAAHQQSLSYADLVVRGATVEGKLRFSVVDLAPLVQLDQDGDGKVTGHDLDLLGQALHRATLGELRLRAGGGECALEPQGGAEMEGDDGLVLSGIWRCPGPVDELEVRVGYLDAMAGGTQLAKIAFAGSNQVAQRLAEPGSQTYVVRRRGTTPASALRFLGLGVEHIFTGFDHIAFLVGLLLLGGSFPALVRIVTSFTVAHSITLALAVLGLVSPPPRLIEPLIAASIVFVAVENLWALRTGGREEGPSRALRHRWGVTFAFGLVHGFGFASALRALDLPRAGLAASLVTFNLGVEVGQICIVALVLPLLGLLQRAPGFRVAGARALSGAVGAAGLFWLGQRILP